MHRDRKGQLAFGYRVDIYFHKGYVPVVNLQLRVKAGNDGHGAQVGGAMTTRSRERPACEGDVLLPNFLTSLSLHLGLAIIAANDRRFTYAAIALFISASLTSRQPGGRMTNSCSASRGIRFPLRCLRLRRRPAILAYTWALKLLRQVRLARRTSSRGCARWMARFNPGRLVQKKHFWVFTYRGARPSPVSSLFLLAWLKGG